MVAKILTYRQRPVEADRAAELRYSRLMRVPQVTIVALGLLCAGCHLIFPFGVLQPDGAAGDARADRAQADVVALEASADEAGTGPDGGKLTKVCPLAADAATTGLFTFADVGGGKFVNQVAGGPTGSLVNGPGYTSQHHAGPPGCAGGGGLTTPEPPHTAKCISSCATVDCTQSGYAVIPSWPGTKLKSGSLDVWVRFDKTTGVHGIVSRDAVGDAQGHFSLYRHADGFIAARLQEASDIKSDFLVCSKPVVVNTWYHVGVNFGPKGLELYVNGVRSAEVKTTSDGTCVDGKDRDVGLEGTDQPWIVGAMGWWTCVGTSAPVTYPLRGTVANFRISKVRRDFAALYK
jgi:hypothetical protein